MLGRDKGCTLNKIFPHNELKDVKTSDELLIIEKRNIDEVVTGICVLLINDAADAAFIK